MGTLRPQHTLHSQDVAAAPPHPTAVWRAEPGGAEPKRAERVANWDADSRVTQHSLPGCTHHRVLPVVLRTPPSRFPFPRRTRVGANSRSDNYRDRPDHPSLARERRSLFGRPFALRSEGEKLGINLFKTIAQVAVDCNPFGGWGRGCRKIL